MNKNFFAGLAVGLGLLAILAFRPAAEKPSEGVQKWEYLETFNGETPKARMVRMNELGAEGWELVTYLGGAQAVFKRAAR